MFIAPPALLALSIAFAPLPTATDTAAPSSDYSASVDTLTRLTPGASRSDVITFVEESAADEQVSPEDFAGRAAAEAVKEDREQVRPTDDTSGAHTAASPDQLLASGGDGKQVLKSARHRGDLYWASASTLEVPHNHVGLYFDVKTITEAPGRNKATHKVAASSLRVKDPQRLEVKRDQTTRDKAADWTGRHLGKPYNIFFPKNKDIETDHYNCSQFVWAAYKKYGPDLDGDGGMGVYPDDIKSDNDVAWY